MILNMWMLFLQEMERNPIAGLKQESLRRKRNLRIPRAASLSAV